jgi:hypothetical protein
MGISRLIAPSTLRDSLFIPDPIHHLDGWEPTT